MNVRHHLRRWLGLGPFHALVLLLLAILTGPGHAQPYPMNYYSPGAGMFPSDCYVAPCSEWQTLSGAWVDDPATAALSYVGIQEIVWCPAYPVTTGVHLLRHDAPGGAWRFILRCSNGDQGPWRYLNWRTAAPTACLPPRTIQDGQCVENQCAQNPLGCAEVIEEVAAFAPQSCERCHPQGNPIYPMTGAKRERVRTGVALAGLELILTYDTTPKLAAQQANATPSILGADGFGGLWRSNFHRKVQVAPSRLRAVVSVGDGTLLDFIGDGAGVFTPSTGNPHRLVSVSGGYVFSDTETGVLEMYDAAGVLTSISLMNGQVLTFSYAAGVLTKVKASDGAGIDFQYTNGLVSKIVAPDARVVSAGYDGSKNLTSLTWPDAKTLTFLYEVPSLPWALTGKVDENNSRLATFGYDGGGRAVSTERAGGVSKFTVSYGSAPVATVAESAPSANRVVRTFSWVAPVDTVVTQPSGESIGLAAQLVNRVPVVSGRSQPSGSGSASSAMAQTFDSNGNIVSRDDAQGSRTCYAHDGQHREVTRVEGLATNVACATVLVPSAQLPPGARRITTAWHPDWAFPSEVTEASRRTTLVHQGQPDPTNGGTLASCTSAPLRPDGKPVPVVCKRVVQALLPSGAADGSAAVSTSTYDARGRLLASTDENSRTMSYSYYATTAFTSDPPQAHDQHFDAVSLLLHGDGTDGSTSVPDSSVSARAVSAVGNARISTAQSRFGGSSLYLDGNGDYLSIADSSDFSFGAGDFTIETVFRTSVGGALVDKGSGGNGPYSWSVGINTNNGRAGATFSAVSDPSTAGVHYITLPGSRDLRDNQWHHVAWTRQGSLFQMWVDGVLEGSATFAPALFTNTTPVSIGAYRTMSSGLITGYFNGHVDEVRITKGVARYAANFSPPTLPFLDHAIAAGASHMGHRAGDLQSVTNPSGQAVTYLYDIAGRPRRLIDAKGVVHETVYTARGFVSTVVSTPPAGVPRTTTYTYDDAGQLAGVSQPDGTSMAYSYDAAHRLVGVADNHGNVITYTLDNAGNRISEEVRDPGGVLRRAIGRSFDALNRVQQVTGSNQ